MLRSPAGSRWDGRLVLVAAGGAVAVLAASASPALAATGHDQGPEVRKQLCAEEGGSFANDAGTKSCTTSETVVETQVVTVSRTVAAMHGYTATLTSTFQRVNTVEVATTRSQHGTSDVTVSASRLVLSSTVVPLTCTLRERHSTFPEGVLVSDQTSPTDLMLCRIYGLFA